MKKESLKSFLTKIIWETGYISFDTMEELCKQNGYRSSNGARRLRFSESPTIETVMKNGAIIGYKPKRTVVTLPPAFLPKTKKPEGLGI